MTLAEQIANCNHHDPFQFLGAHFNREKKGTVTLRSYQPEATAVFFLSGDLRQPMSEQDQPGIFSCTLNRADLPDPDLDPYHYQYEVHYATATVRKNDPYRFPVALGEEDRFLFNKGTNYKIYNHLGAHRTSLCNVSGMLFRVWAPNARSISVVGDFNFWDIRPHQMRSLGASGIWELFIPDLGLGEIYKYSIQDRFGNRSNKADPFQFYGELRPRTGSITTTTANYIWQDGRWQEQQTANTFTSPLSIYELHPGSWRRDPNEPQRFLSFQELSRDLIPYVVEMGFTHIELLPVMEHPLDESWGYQVAAPYSISSRFGEPEDFMAFVDACHQSGIGVILDWVPAHFPKDAHSLGRFDGTPLFEHEDERLGCHPDWGTFVYNYGRKEVSNYLIANALFWFDKYHIDGLRVDAVASMIYLDYSRKDGEWLPNRYGGNLNLEAIEFFRHLNSIVKDLFPSRLMIAEESTSFEGVTRSVANGGLGFDYKWNMGWMNDMLSYMSRDPIHRKFHHNDLTFSMTYAFSENFILPLSHDEVAHGKGALLDKMPGDIWQKFANLRLLLAFMWTHPGKKLLFMGAELGQFAEWNCKQSLDWHLLDNTFHVGLQNSLKRLNSIYKEHAALWQLADGGASFSWLDLDDRDNSIVSFARYAENWSDHLICIFNFTPQTHYGYKIALAQQRDYEVLFCSDDIPYGGSGAVSQQRVTPTGGAYAHGQGQTIMDIAPLSSTILRPVPAG
ncbi:MAG: 1,4-alpha-glucan branching enzyme [Deltaproteobacteria bacterium]|nr:MAG: 1,4-alpha-glucan branching enzyme [Deltaproteobacteria bacterium]